MSNNKENPLKIPNYLWKFYWENYPWKMKAMARDGYKCSKCSKKPPEVRLHIHHLDKNGHESKSFNGEENNQLNNLITLCTRCHAYTHYVEFKMNPNVGMMKEMKKQGLTYQEIGDEFGLSRQRIHQLLKGYINSRGKIINPNAY